MVDAAVVALGGCSTNSTMTSSQKHQLISEYNQQKTFEIECSTGCKVSYKDPRDQLKLPSATNGYDVLNTAIKATAGVITTAVPYAAIGYVASESINNSGGNVSGSYNTESLTQETTDQSSSNSSSYNDSYNSDSSNRQEVISDYE